MGRDPQFWIRCFLPHTRCQGSQNPLGGQSGHLQFEQARAPHASALSLVLVSRGNCTCGLLRVNEGWGCPAPPCNFLLPTPCNSMKTFSLQYSTVIPVLNASAIKEVTGVMQRQGPCAFTKHRALLLQFAASFLLANLWKTMRTIIILLACCGHTGVGNYMPAFSGCEEDLTQVSHKLTECFCYPVNGGCSFLSWDNQISHISIWTRIWSWQERVMYIWRVAHKWSHASYQADTQSSALRAAKGSLSQSSLKNFKSKKDIPRTKIERQYLRTSVLHFHGVAPL